MSNKCNVISKEDNYFTMGNLNSIIISIIKLRKYFFRFELAHEKSKLAICLS